MARLILRHLSVCPLAKVGLRLPLPSKHLRSLPVEPLVRLVDAARCGSRVEGIEPRMSGWTLARCGATVGRVDVSTSSLACGRPCNCDDLLQTITALGLRLDLCRQLWSKNDSAGLEEELARLETCWEQSLNAKRELDAVGSGGAPDDDSLSEAIGYLAGWYEDQTGIEVSLNLERLPESQLSSGQKGTLVRIIQEALRNVHQHASASCVLIWAANSNGGCLCLPHGVTAAWQCGGATSVRRGCGDVVNVGADPRPNPSLLDHGVPSQGEFSDGPVGELSMVALLAGYYNRQDEVLAIHSEGAAYQPYLIAGPDRHFV